MAVTKRLRYEIFRRDGHVCRYCGRRPPDVTLVVDHLVARALGGSDEPTNLTTSCEDCNLGKGSSTQDAETLEQIARDRRSWQTAMSQAIEIRLRDRQRLETQVAEITEAWNAWHLIATRRKKQQPVPRPADWADQAGRWLAKGLPLEDMVRLIPVAMMAQLRWRDDEYGVWRYYMGCCRNVMRQIEETARALVETQQAAEAEE